MLYDLLINCWIQLFFVMVFAFTFYYYSTVIFLYYSISFKCFFHTLKYWCFIGVFLWRFGVAFGCLIFYFWKLLENLSLAGGEVGWYFYSEGYYMVSSSFHALNTLFYINFTEPFRDRVEPSCVPSGILISLRSQTVSTCLVDPNAAWEIVIHSVEWISCPIFLNFGCFFTDTLRIKSPLGPF